MGVTKIQWADYTMNPWVGCQHATVDGVDDPMCRNCYAEVGTMARVQRSRGLPLWGEGAHRHGTSADYWRQPLRWEREAAASGERRRVFCASLADVFEDRRDLDAWRAHLFTLIGMTPHLDWLLLTKRPEKMVELAPSDWRAGWPPNAWAGTSTGTQAAVDARLPELVRVPARVRFLSVEPLLEPVDLATWFISAMSPDGKRCAIDWAIVGGESGPNARPCALEWIESAVEQCRAAHVRPFVKQLGAFAVSEQRTFALSSGERENRGLTREQLAPNGEAWAWRAGLRDKKGGDMAEWPEQLRVRELPAVRP